MFPSKLLGSMQPSLLMPFLYDKAITKYVNKEVKEMKFWIFSEIWLFFRSTCPGVFCKKGALRNFAKFTGKHLFQGIFFNKAAGLRQSCEISKNTFSYSTPPVAASVSY